MPVTSVSHYPVEPPVAEALCKHATPPGTGACSPAYASRRNVYCGGIAQNEVKTISLAANDVMPSVGKKVVLARESRWAVQE